MPNHPVPYRPGGLLPTRQERALIRQAGAIQAELFIARAYDVARRERTNGRISDLGTATRHGLAEGDGIAADLEERIERRPWAVKALGGIAARRLPGHPPRAARLHAEPRLTLLVTEQYEVRQSTAGWHVEIVGYLYAIGYEDHELVSYHWHPSGKSTITQPHMHVGAAVQIGDRWLGKVHLPTGMVGLEQVIRARKRRLEKLLQRLEREDRE